LPAACHSCPRPSPRPSSPEAFLPTCSLWMEEE
jgi:hypothetical protein